LGYGNDVIGVPKSFSSAEVPSSLGLGSRNASQLFQAVQLSNAIETAEGADAAISLEDALAQVTRVAAKLPFFYAPFGTEGEAAGRNFQIAPATKTTAM
jgi:hypothetical protein